jgi:hypothetical protein
MNHIQKGRYSGLPPKPSRFTSLAVLATLLSEGRYALPPPATIGELLAHMNFPPATTSTTSAMMVSNQNYAV